MNRLFLTALLASLPIPKISLQELSIDELIGPDSPDGLINDCLENIKTSAQVRQNNGLVTFCCNLIERSEEELNTEGTKFDLEINAHEFEQFLAEARNKYHSRILELFEEANVQIAQALDMLK